MLISVVLNQLDEVAETLLIVTGLEAVLDPLLQLLVALQVPARRTQGMQYIYRD